MTRRSKLEPRIALLCSAVLALPPTSLWSAPATAGAAIPTALSRLQTSSQEALDKTDQSIAAAAKKLAAVPDLKSDAAKQILLELHKSCPFSIDCCAISPEGIMLAIEPETFKRFEGSDISKQDVVSRLLKTRAPAMGGQFKTVEGILAVDIEHPIMTDDGKFRGAVSMIFQPHVLLGKTIPPLIKGLPVEVWAMQRDGLIIYDADSGEIGRMLFTDALYAPFTELLHLGKRISAEPAGFGFYAFFKTGTKEKVNKETWWASVGLHGTEWRLVQTHTSGIAQQKDLAPAGAPAGRDALNELAGNADLAKALAGNDRESAMSLFKAFAMSHSGVYSVSWIDGKSISRFGYPPENSLSDFDLNTDPSNSGAQCVKSIREKKERSFEDMLIEGGRARFTIVPVHGGGVFLGGLLLIQRL